MGDHIDINGHATWVEQLDGDGDTVLLLHGGLSNSDVLLDSIGAGIRRHHRVVAFDRRGQGRTADTAAPFHYDDMAAETIAVLERVVDGPAHLVGWSDGGIVSLLVALQRPELVRRMVLIGANFHHDGNLPMEHGPSEEAFAMIRQSYDERSPDGPEHFEEVAGKSFQMFASEPTMTVDDLRRIEAPTLVMVGDDDLMSLSHTVELYESLPFGQLSVVPGTSHVLPLEQPDVVIDIIERFLASPVSPPTMMPVRRR
jgi:pimeloyl-ACP methyl ester carboxylesterase